MVDGFSIWSASRFKSQVGAMMPFKGGKGLKNDVLAKPKLESSTTSELLGEDCVLPLALWAPLFLGEHGHNVQENTMNQDSKSTISLAKNGKTSSGKRTRALNI